MPSREAERAAQKALVSGDLRTPIEVYGYLPPKDPAERKEVRSIPASFFGSGLTPTSAARCSSARGCAESHSPGAQIFIQQ